ncbi:MAG: alpha/beta fold hydrolase [Myxococcota bacterium]|nr:alpha/beta fold hydrolase [Myxococcota bacterium]
MTHRAATKLMLDLPRPPAGTPTPVAHPLGPALRLGQGPRLLLFHGMSPRAHQDPRMLDLARALAAQGLQVWLPHLPDIAAFHIHPRSVDRMAAWLRALRPRALMSVSFSGGLALQAAARTPNTLACAVSIGGFHRVREVARFLMEDPTADSYGRRVLLVNHLRSTGEDTLLMTALLTSLMDEGLQRRPQLHQALQALSPGQRARYAALTCAPSRHWSERIQADDGLHMDALDLDHARPDCPVLLLHGAGDRVIPWEQSRSLHQAWPDSHLCVTPLLDHGDLQSFSPRPAWALHKTLRRLLSLAR